MRRTISGALSIMLAAAMFITVWSGASAQAQIFDIMIDTGAGAGPPPSGPIFFPPGVDSRLSWQFRDAPDGVSVLRHGVNIDGTRITENDPLVTLSDGITVDVRRVGEFGAQGIFSVPPGPPPGEHTIFIFVETTDPASDRSTAESPFTFTTGETPGESDPTGTPDPGSTTDDPGTPGSTTVPGESDGSSTPGEEDTPFSIGFPANTPSTGITTTTIQGSDQGIAVCKFTDPSGDPTVFNFQSTLGPTALSDTQCDFSGNIPPGRYHVAEVVPAGWALVSVACFTDIFGNGNSATNVVGPAVTIDLAENDYVVCEYDNAIDVDSPGDDRGLSVLGSSIVPTAGIGIPLDGVETPAPADTGTGGTAPAEGAPLAVQLALLALALTGVVATRRLAGPARRRGTFRDTR